MPKVVLAVLTREMVSTRWAFAFRELRLPEGTKILPPIAGLPFDHGRNEAVKAALTEGADWLLFIDDDVIAPPDTFERLSSHGREIVSGLYYRRNAPITPVMFYESGGRPVPVSRFNRGGLLEVDFVGAGCLLIHKTVFSAIEKPFEWMMDRTDLPPGERVGEDMAFCAKARKAGFRVAVDTTVECHHLGLGETRPDGHFVPFARSGEEWKVDQLKPIEA